VQAAPRARSCGPKHVYYGWFVSPYPDREADMHPLAATNPSVRHSLTLEDG
jgi:hypothetical protein